MSEDYRLLLFQHLDDEADKLEVWREPDQNSLVFRIDPRMQLSSAVRIPRSELERLYNVIGQELYPQTLGPAPGEMAAAVKALMDAFNDMAGLPRPLWSPDRDSFRITGPECDEHGDPSPHDAGHPEPEPLCHRTAPEDAHMASRCTWCGHLWRMHSGAVPAEHGRLMSELPRRVRTGAKCECGHTWEVHSPQARIGCFAAPGGDVCECGRTAPQSAPEVACTCSHPRQMHGPYGCGYLGECSCKYVGEGP